MSDIEIVHNKVRCPFCHDAYMQFEFIVPYKKDSGKIDLEIFMSCEKTLERRCTGRMRINANACRVETWESMQKE